MIQTNTQKLEKSLCLCLKFYLYYEVEALLECVVSLSIGTLCFITLRRKKCVKSYLASYSPLPSLALPYPRFLAPLMPTAVMAIPMMPTGVVVVNHPTDPSKTSRVLSIMRASEY
jgi:hypothetical protein